MLSDVMCCFNSLLSKLVAEASAPRSPAQQTPAQQTPAQQTPAQQAPAQPIAVSAGPL